MFTFIVSAFSALTLAMARKLTNELDELEKDVMFGGYKVYEFGESHLHEIEETENLMALLPPPPKKYKMTDIRSYLVPK